MTIDEIPAQLQILVTSPDFAEQSEGLVDSWIAEGFGVEAVEPILRFMEGNPNITYGMPGALVHFVERFYLHGYEQFLLESIRRKPTPHTVWMLNRLINGTKEVDVRKDYILELKMAKEHRPLSENTKAQIEQFLDRLTSE